MIRCSALAVLLLLNVAAFASEAADDYELARKELEAGDISTALDHFEAALQADPGDLRYGSDYRQAIIRIESYDRCLAFFEKLTGSHPQVANAFLNYGFAYVDKIPAAGAITRVLLANTALQQFTKALEIETSWLGLYTRGNTYLYWPKVFNRAALGVADLEAAYEVQKSEHRSRLAHALVFVALGDGYWKTDQIGRARETWEQGLAPFPESEYLKQRLSLEGEELAAYLNAELDPNKRVDTDLSLLWVDDEK